VYPEHRWVLTAAIARDFLFRPTFQDGMRAIRWTIPLALAAFAALWTGPIASGKTHKHKKPTGLVVLLPKWQRGVPAAQRAMTDGP
jgi:hypothetical protein